MDHTGIRRDIAAAVHQAVTDQLDGLNEAAMVRRSDALLASLPGIGGSRPTTTAMLLLRYHTPLHQELCSRDQPRVAAVSVEVELSELTRAVLLTAGIREGMSIDAALGMALVLYKRGVAPFCALP